MDVYGLTGGIGSGKSEVAGLLERYGIPVVSADELSRVVVARGSQGLEDVVRLFGPFVLNEDGELDRRRMAAIVFEDPSKRRDLEGILHPRIRERFEQVLDALEKAGHAVAVYEVPLLFEKNLQGEMKAVILVTADEAARIRRVQARDDVTEAEVRGRIAAQMDEDTKRKRADYIIENNGSMDDLRREVEFMLDRFMRIGTRRNDGTLPSQRSTEEIVIQRRIRESTEVPAIGPPPSPSRMRTEHPGDGPPPLPSRTRTEALHAASVPEGPPPPSFATTPVAAQAPQSPGPPAPRAQVTERMPTMTVPAPGRGEQVPVRSGHTVVARYPAPPVDLGPLPPVRSEPPRQPETAPEGPSSAEATGPATPSEADDVFAPPPIPAPDPPRIAPGTSPPRIRPPRISPTRTLPMPIVRGKGDDPNGG